MRKNLFSGIQAYEVERLITTDKILITDNRMLLPSQPDGALVFNMAMVYDNDDVVTPCDGMTIEQSGSRFYARFTDADAEIVNGQRGVVSYLAMVSIL